jgi:ribonuclease I
MEPEKGNLASHCYKSGWNECPSTTPTQCHACHLYMLKSSQLEQKNYMKHGTCFPFLA